MIKKETKIKLLEILEKGFSNAKNADRTTLWTVIALLALSIFIDATTASPQITINIPAATTASPAKGTAGRNSNMEEFDTSSIQDMRAVFGEAPEKFKYCYLLEIKNNSPFADKVENIYTFIIDEKDNDKGETFYKTSYVSDYRDTDIMVRNSWWFKNQKKVPCTQEIIKNNTREAIAKRF